MTRSFRAIALAAIGCLAAGVSATAATAPGIEPGRAAVLQALTDCRKLTDAAPRLACFDKATEALDVAESHGEVVVMDREQVKAVKRQAFGFNLPTLHIFDRSNKPDERIDHLVLDLDGAHHDAEGHWVFVSADGAVWRQTDAAELGEDPHKGSKLLVKNGVLGSFFCKVDNQPQVRCQRVS
jgi:mannose-6-phosphate isomerase-like protein (cupin superfamily)